MIEYQEHTAIDAEMSVAGSILIDPRCISDILETELTPEDFTEGPLRKIFSIACRLYSEGREIDPVIIRAEAPGELETDYLLQLMEITPTAANAAQYSRIIKQTALKRKAAMHSHIPEWLEEFGEQIQNLPVTPAEIAATGGAGE